MQSFHLISILCEYSCVEVVKGYKVSYQLSRWSAALLWFLSCFNIDYISSGSSKNHTESSESPTPWQGWGEHSLFQKKTQTSSPSPSSSSVVNFDLWISKSDRLVCCLLLLSHSYVTHAKHALQRSCRRRQLVRLCTLTLKSKTSCNSQFKRSIKKWLQKVEI